jgi:hypothetical protein
VATVVAKVGVNFNYTISKVLKKLKAYFENYGTARANMCLRRSGYTLEEHI